MPESSIKCPVCGKEYRQLISHIKVHGLTTDEFRRIYPALPLTSETSSIIRCKKKSPESSIQKALFTYLLTTYGDGFVSEYRLGQCFIDIAYPKAKLAIEVDGDYHHTDHSSKITERCKRFDEYKRIALDSLGWNLLRFTENMLYHCPGKAVITICDTLGLPRPVSEEEVETLDITPGIQKACCICGAPLSVKMILAGRKHCSRACFSKDRAINGICLNCKRPDAHYLHGKHRFCSEQCFLEYFHKHGKGERNCLCCGKTMYPLANEPELFCDIDCQREYEAIPPEFRRDMSANLAYNKRRREEGRVYFDCSYCGKHTWTHRRSWKANPSGPHFCCSACYHAYTKGKPRKKEIK